MSTHRPASICKPWHPHLNLLTIVRETFVHEVCKPFFFLIQVNHFADLNNFDCLGVSKCALLAAVPVDSVRWPVACVSSQTSAAAACEIEMAVAPAVMRVSVLTLAVYLYCQIGWRGAEVCHQEAQDASHVLYVLECEGAQEWQAISADHAAVSWVADLKDRLTISVERPHGEDVTVTSTRLGSSSGGQIALTSSCTYLTVRCCSVPEPLQGPGVACVKMKQSPCTADYHYNLQNASCISWTADTIMVGAQRGAASTESSEGNRTHGCKWGHQPVQYS